MKDNLTPQDSQTLSAYLDDRLSSREKARLETRLQQQKGLRDELEALKQTRLMLHTLPKRRAPRNFTLSPAMAPHKPVLQLFPAFRFASALAGVLLVAAFLGQYVLGSGIPASQSAAPAAFAVSSNKSIAPGASADTTNKLPVIISWGTPTLAANGAMGLGGASGLGGGFGGGPQVANAPETANATAETPTPDTAVPPQLNSAAPTPTGAEASTGLPLAAQAETTQTPAAPAAALAPTVNGTASTPANDAYLSGNPILGIQRAGVQNTPEPTPEIAAPETGSEPMPFWRWLETGLGLVGICLALAAFYFYRKEK